MADSVHLRCQIEYEKGFENFVDTVLDCVGSIADLEVVDGFYFLRQDYSKRFNRHVQLDVFTEKDSEQELRGAVEKVLEESEAEYYWEDEFVSTWYGLTGKEDELLLENRINNSELALRTFEAYRKGQLDHLPHELVNRNYHLNANMHGMTHWDELKFCLKRGVQIPLIQLTSLTKTGENLYNKVFLRKELKNIENS